MAQEIKEISDELVKQIMENLDVGEKQLAEVWRSEGQTDREIAEFLYYMG